MCFTSNLQCLMIFSLQLLELLIWKTFRVPNTICLTCFAFFRVVSRLDCKDHQVGSNFKDLSVKVKCNLKVLLLTGLLARGFASSSFRTVRSQYPVVLSHSVYINSLSGCIPLRGGCRRPTY